jgi:hypothetical protein
MPINEPTLAPLQGTRAISFDDEDEEGADATGGA